MGSGWPHVDTGMRRVSSESALITAYERSTSVHSTSASARITSKFNSEKNYDKWAHDGLMSIPECGDFPQNLHTNEAHRSSQPVLQQTETASKSGEIV
jgi:hypothetical protein